MFAERPTLRMRGPPSHVYEASHRSHTKIKRCWSQVPDLNLTEEGTKEGLETMTVYKKDRDFEILDD